MKNENKDILLKDLCARLPYGVVCHTSVGDYKLLGIDIYKNEAHLDSPVYDEGDGYFDLEYGEVKPYLRQMSSMTQEEIENTINYVKPMMVILRENLFILTLANLLITLTPYTLIIETLYKGGLLWKHQKICTNKRYYEK